MQKTARIDWKPFSEKHKRYIRRALENRMNVAEGAIRSGKTIDNCIIAAMYLETCADKFHLASGSTLANAKLNIGVCNGFGLEYLFRGRCKWKLYRGNDALFIQTQTGEKVVVFAGGSKANSYQKILGNSYGLWIATEINEHYDSEDSRSSFIKVAMGRQVAAINPLILWDLNPCNPHHPIYENYIDKYKDGFVGGYQYEHFTIKDNKAITPERLAQIESQYTRGSIWWRRDIEGERCIAEGLIYPMWEKALCEPPADWQAAADDYCVAIDYGTMNAFAALLFVHVRGTWYAVREYYWSGRDKGIQKTDAEYLQDIEIWLMDILERTVYATTFGRMEVIVDPSAASFIALLAKTRWAKVHKADNDVKNGLHETANALDNGYVKVCNNLENWRSEAGGYRWDPKAKDDAPLKERDHLMDATRYFVKTKCIIRKATRRSAYGIS